MGKVVVEFINPNAKQLLLDLEALNLIAIKEPNNILPNLKKEYENNLDSVPTMEEIVKEVKIVRAERYEKRKTQNYY